MTISTAGPWRPPCGSVPATILESQFPQARASLYEAVADSIQALRGNKVDALMESTAVVADIRRSQGDAVRVLDAPALAPSLVSFGVKMGDQLWLNYLNNFIMELQHQPGRQRLLQPVARGRRPRPDQIAGRPMQLYYGDIIPYLGPLLTGLAMSVAVSTAAAIGGGAFADPALRGPSIKDPGVAHDGRDLCRSHP